MSTRNNRQQVSVGKLAMASLVGTTIEWYDFQLYGMAAAVAFDKLFFPNLSQLAGTLALFALIYAVGFVARPLGGIVFGHFGDRVGRKKLLRQPAAIGRDVPDRLCPPTRASGSPSRSWWCCASCKASRSAANGAARSCSSASTARTPARLRSSWPQAGVARRVPAGDRGLRHRDAAAG